MVKKLLSATRKRLRNGYFRYKMLRYAPKVPKIQAKIARKDKIKVVFFVLFESMWKSDRIFRMLLNDADFDPYIISSPRPDYPEKLSRENQDKLKLFFESKGFPFICGYDFDNKQWFDIQSFDPDVVLYQQPYNTGYKGFLIESLWDKCLFGYIPYCYCLEVSEHFHNNLLYNMAWRVFEPSRFEKEEGQAYLLADGRNHIVTGLPIVDSFISPDGELQYPWAQKEKDIKRIIWAPHHSIGENDTLSYSNFLEISDEMVALCKEYEERVQFAFKPHPVLKNKLYNHPAWGVNRTDAYYEAWATMPNSILQEGNYEDLFLTSDAMIHDSSSFTAEYLLVDKPVMYLTKENHEEALSEFGKKCFHQHYRGTSIQDVRHFIDTVVLGGQDTLQEQRHDFFQQNLLPPNGLSATENIFNEFRKLAHAKN